MLLRSLTQHIKDQNWFAVGLDFVIVVAGILIAFQITNWNENQNKRASEMVYLQGLAKDVRSDIADIDEINRVSTLRMSAMGYLLEHATGAELADGFDSARGRIAIEPSPPYDPTDSNSIGVAMFILTTLDGNRLTYDTMINTGGIGIIRDDDLVREIQTYYANVDKALSFEESLEINRVKLVDAQQMSGVSPVDTTPAKELITTFSNNQPLLAAAKNYWLYTNRQLKIMKDLRAEAAQLADILEHRIGL